MFSYDIDLNASSGEETKPYYDVANDDPSLVPYYDGDIVTYGNLQNDDDDDDVSDEKEGRVMNRRKIDKRYENYLKKLLKDANINFMDPTELSRQSKGDSNSSSGEDSSSSEEIDDGSNKIKSVKSQDFYFSGESQADKKPVVVIKKDGKMHIHDLNILSCYLKKKQVKTDI